MQKNVEGHLDSVSAGGLFLKKAFRGEDEKNLVKCLAETTTAIYSPIAEIIAEYTYCYCLKLYCSSLYTVHCLIIWCVFTYSCISLSL